MNPAIQEKINQLLASLTLLMEDVSSLSTINLLCEPLQFCLRTKTLVKFSIPYEDSHFKKNFEKLDGSIRSQLIEIVNEFNGLVDEVNSAAVSVSTKVTSTLSVAGGAGGAGGVAEPSRIFRDAKSRLQGHLPVLTSEKLALIAAKPFLSPLFEILQRFVSLYLEELAAINKEIELESFLVKLDSFIPLMDMAIALEPICKFPVNLNLTNLKGILDLKSLLLALKDFSLNYQQAQARLSKLKSFDLAEHPLRAEIISRRQRVIEGLERELAELDRTDQLVDLRKKIERLFELDSNFTMIFLESPFMVSPLQEVSSLSEFETLVEDLSQMSVVCLRKERELQELIKDLSKLTLHKPEIRDTLAFISAKRSELLKSISAELERGALTLAELHMREKQLKELADFDRALQNLLPRLTHPLAISGELELNLSLLENWQKVDEVETIKESMVQLCKRIESLVFSDHPLSGPIQTQLALILAIYKREISENDSVISLLEISKKLQRLEELQQSFYNLFRLLPVTINTELAAENTIEELEAVCSHLNEQMQLYSKAFSSVSRLHKACVNVTAYPENPKLKSLLEAVLAKRKELLAAVNEQLENSTPSLGELDEMKAKLLELQAFDQSLIAHASRFNFSLAADDPIVLHSHLVQRLQVKNDSLSELITTCKSDLERLRRRPMRYLSSTIATSLFSVGHSKFSCYGRLQESRNLLIDALSKMLEGEVDEEKLLNLTWQLESLELLDKSIDTFLAHNWATPHMEAVIEILSSANVAICDLKKEEFLSKIQSLSIYFQLFSLLKESPCCDNKDVVAARNIAIEGLVGFIVSPGALTKITSRFDHLQKLDAELKQVLNLDPKRSPKGVSAELISEVLLEISEAYKAINTEAETSSFKRTLLETAILTHNRTDFVATVGGAGGGGASLSLN